MLRLKGCFLFRFQIAFALFGFFSWLFFMRVESKRFYLKYITAFIMVLIFGFLLDSWFYETLTFTPFNYLNEFIANFFIESLVSPIHVK